MQALAQLKHAGPEEYGKEIQARASILHAMLDRYNDGRHKTLFCLAADLLAQFRAQAGKDLDNDRMLFTKQ